MNINNTFITKIYKDPSETVNILGENSSLAVIDTSHRVANNKFDSDISNNMVRFLMSPPKCIYPKEYTDIFSSY